MKAVKIGLVVFLCAGVTMGGNIPVSYTPEDWPGSCQASADLHILVNTVEDYDQSNTDSSMLPCSTWVQSEVSDMWWDGNEYQSCAGWGRLESEIEKTTAVDETFSLISHFGGNTGWSGPPGEVLHSFDSSWETRTSGTLTVDDSISLPEGSFFILQVDVTALCDDRFSGSTGCSWDLSISGEEGYLNLDETTAATGELDVSPGEELSISFRVDHELMGYILHTFYPENDWFTTTAEITVTPEPTTLGLLLLGGLVILRRRRRV